MKRVIILIIGLIIGVFVASKANAQLQLPCAEKIKSSIYRLVSRAEFKTPEGKIITVETKGMGVAVSARRIFALDHVISKYSDYSIAVHTAEGEKEEAFEKISDVTYLISSENKEVKMATIIKNRKNDIALLETPSGLYLNSIYASIGNDDEISKKDSVYLVAKSELNDLVFKKGVVKDLKAPAFLEKVMVDPETAFTITNDVIPGDSGAPIINEKCRVVGITQGEIMEKEHLGWALRINFIMRKISSLIS